MFDKKNIRTYYLMISRKIRNFLLSQKSREFLVFLFFVFVSFCFWLMQTMNDLYQAEFKMPVRLRNVPKEVVLTSELPDEIRVRVEDRGTVLLNYMLGRTFFPVSFDFEEYRDRGDHVHISSAEIFMKVATQLNTSTKLLSVRPDTLEIIYTEGKAKKVPVVLDGHVSAGRQYYVSDIHFSPDSVMVYAPKEVLGSITAAYTQPLELENITDTLNQRVAIRKVKGAKFVPATNDMSVYVDMYSEKTVDVPIVGVDFPPGKVLRTFPSKAQVTFQVGLKHFKEVTANDFFIGIHYKDLLRNKEERVPLSVQTFSPYASRVRVIPSSADYLIEEQQVTETHD